MGVDAVRLPEVPVMVTVVVPGVAVLLTANVTTLEVVAGFTVNVAVTPLGRPLAASVTEPLNGLTSVTVMVEVALVFWASDIVPGEGVSVKLPPDLAPVTVSAMVVVAVSEPEVPVMVMAVVAAAAVLLAVRVSTLVEVVGLVANAAVTPAGNPEAARVTLFAAQLDACFTTMVSVPLPPWAIDSVAAEGARVKPVGIAPFAVSAMVVVALNEPEVPVMVTVPVPIATEQLAVSVSTLVEVVGLVANAAVTPVGRPLAARVTGPVNPPMSVIVMVSVTLAPGPIDKLDGEGVSRKLPVVVMITVIVVVVVMAPEVPVTVTVPVPLAVLLAFIVSVFPLNMTVTPGFELAAVKVTAPVKPPVSVIVMATVQLPPWGMVQLVGEGAIEKLPIGEIVTPIVVVAVVVPEVPVTVMVADPVAVLLALMVSVSPLTVTVTPELELAAVRVTAPLKPPVSVTVMASVALAPWAIERVAAEGFREKLPPPPGATPLTEQAVPLSENAVGMALVAPFHVPLNPSPVRLAPAAMLPL
jgi:hypothetical protein